MTNNFNLQTSIVFSVAILCSPLAASEASQTQTIQQVDVIVYGATPGGFCAAVAAAREGASVILLEPTKHIGGLSTGGLSHCDSNQMRRETLMGLFDEWHRRIVKDYTDRGLPAPYNPAFKNTAKWTFEPHVAMRVTRAMLQEAGVTVLTERYLTAVNKDGARITSIVTKAGTYSAKVFVDGTYEGDLMAAAGVDWTIGREGRAEFGETLAGKQYPKKTMEVRGFDETGNLLPLITTGDAGPEDAPDQNVMTYSFRLCLTRNAAKKVPLPAPANYNPERFELARRILNAGITGVGFDLYPLPGGKLDGNNSIGGQLSLGLIGGGNHWHSADQVGRAKIWETHKQYTLEFLHFLRTDPAVPSNVREKFSGLGLCNDEFLETDHFPPALYIRESRRLEGMYVLSQKDIAENPEKDDAIAVSSFPIDSHDCQRVALKDGGVVNEGTIFPVRVPGSGVGYAYHVPYRSVLPKPAQCTNLLVPVALSSTHVAMSSLRIEGAWMVIGQGAGVAAALAAKQDVTVQDLPYAILRAHLIAQGQVLELPPEPTQNSASNAAGFIPIKSLSGIILDNTNAILKGQWSHSTNFKPSIGSGYVFSGSPDTRGDGTSSATFRFRVPKSGNYELLMAYSPHETRAKNVPLNITSGASETEFIVDQTRSLPAGENFQYIGTVVLSSEFEATIQISNTNTAGFVIIDAIQLKPLAPPTAAELTLNAPLDYQVVQRLTREQGLLRIIGELSSDVSLQEARIEAKFVSEQSETEWLGVAGSVSGRKLSGTIEAPAGGWWRLEVRLLQDGKIVAAGSVPHVGIGEVFVIAGQSNSANHGEQRQQPKTGRVTTYDGQAWRLANDPQPGASGNGGSFIPPFADAVVEREKVPVGIVACGIGATSVREWLPRGTVFPNPPTIESRVEKQADGSWISKGEAYDNFIARMKPLGVRGFRAVLWHQGESDANQKDSSRTLSGKLYRKFLEQLILESRRDIGWESPWFVAQASYHVPGDEGSDEIRDAQVSLWKDGIALQGPDSDALKGDSRERNGQGVHFSGPGLQAHGKAWAEKVLPWMEKQYAALQD